MTLVPSLNAPNHIDTSGFELADNAANMLAWLGKGDDCRRFVVNDIEDGLYQQAPGGQVLAVSCNDTPEITTATQANDNVSNEPVTGFRVIFPLTVRVRTPQGALWKLDVLHSYEATDSGTGDGQANVRTQFAVQAHEQMA
jgi:hypothetical protein